MDISSYSPQNFKHQERRKQLFLVFIWVGIVLVISRLIESIFFTRLVWTEVVVDFIYGIIILGLMVLILEKGKTLK
jgi:hypothetical protein